MEAVLFIGIQASGKSSFYKARFSDTHIRLNRDMLKTRHRESILFRSCLEAKQPFVLDNTNLTIAERQRSIELAQAARFQIVGYYFQSILSAALLRNQAREAGKIVPDKGIAGAYKRLQLPSFAEGFDRLYYVALNDNSQFHIEDWNDGL